MTSPFRFDRDPEDSLKVGRRPALFRLSGGERVSPRAPLRTPTKSNAGGRRTATGQHPVARRLGPERLFRRCPPLCARFSKTVKHFPARLFQICARTSPQPAPATRLKQFSRAHISATDPARCRPHCRAVASSRFSFPGSALECTAVEAPPRSIGSLRARIAPTRLSFSSDGKQLACGFRDGPALLWDFAAIDSSELTREHK